MTLQRFVKVWCSMAAAFCIATFVLNPAVWWLLLLAAFDIAMIGLKPAVDWHFNRSFLPARNIDGTFFACSKCQDPYDCGHRRRCLHRHVEHATIDYPRGLDDPGMTQQLDNEALLALHEEICDEHRAQRMWIKLRDAEWSRAIESSGGMSPGGSAITGTPYLAMSFKYISGKGYVMDTAPKYKRQPYDQTIYFTPRQMRAHCADILTRLDYVPRHIEIDFTLPPVA